jgi:desumoylating isopeptidase 1
VTEKPSTMKAFIRKRRLTIRSISTGIWHTGVLVFNKEYFYGGGIQVSPLGVFSASNNLPPVQTLMIGSTSKTVSELDAFLASIHSRFTAHTYDLIRNNCNNFSNEVCQFLTGQGIPSFIIDLPNIVFSSPGAMRICTHEYMYLFIYVQSF